MSRCKACNAALRPNEIIYNESIGQHEELCRVCRDIIKECEDDDKGLKGLTHTEDLREDSAVEYVDFIQRDEADE